MAKKGKKEQAPVAEKRPASDLETSESEDDDFQVDGLLDIEADESDEDSADEDSAKSDDAGDSASGESEDEEEEELNRLLAEEEQSDSESDSDGSSEAETINDKLSGIKLKTIDTADSGEIHTKYIDGTDRIIKPEIEPVYDSDDSDVDNFNTIGNIPMSAYEEMPHLGYDINGKRIMRPARGSALDQLLEQIELPQGWTGLLDQNTGQSLNLTEEELELIRKIQNNENTDESINPYEPIIEWFTSKTEVMPLSAAPEPKRRFMPSKHEAKRVMKIVRAIREGKIIPPEKVKEMEEEELYDFDLWEKEDKVNDHVMNLRAPKLPPPTNDESYNPPEEYLFTEEEKKKWLETDRSERDTSYIPQKYSALRKVPAYQESVRERFERSLDLYLAPRVRRNKTNLDSESMIPELPSPKDLRPFPIKCSTIFEGHTGRIRTISIDPTGSWLATGSDDGSVRVWEVLTGRQVFKAQVIDIEEEVDDKIDALEWHPDSATPILAVAAAEKILLMVPSVFGFDFENAARVKIESGWGFQKFGHKRKDASINVNDDDEAGKVAEARKDVASWYTPNEEESRNCIAAIIEVKKPVKKLSWHRKGDYFVTVSPESKNTSVLIHQLSKHLTQSPFKKSKGITTDAKFHPTKPQLFVSSKRTIRIYDLAEQSMIKKLMPGAMSLASIDIHPRGDHLLACSYDKRVLWHDLDLSSMPYKTLRFHDKAVRATAFHKGKLPLFASASDDGAIHVFHGMVYDDFMTNPLLVPLKKLTGHKIVSSIGVLDLVWHPREAWLFSSGADNTARLWTT